MTQATDTVNGESSKLSKQLVTIARPAQNADSYCSTIRRKTYRARQCYFNGMLDNDGAAGQCDTVRRRRQKLVAYWQQGNNGGGGLAADETDSGIALTPEWEFVPPDWPRNENCSAGHVARRKQAAGRSVQMASLRVPQASEWGSAFDTMIAQLRCRLPGPPGPDKLAIIDHEYFGQACNSDSAAAVDGSGPATLLPTPASQDHEPQNSSDSSQVSAESNCSSNCGSSCSSSYSTDCSHDIHPSNGDDSGTSIYVTATTTSTTTTTTSRAAAGCHVPNTFQDIIYRRTGRSLTINIAPSIVKTASNNEVWIKLRNDQDEAHNSGRVAKSRHTLPQAAASRQVGDTKKSSYGEGGEGGECEQTGRWQTLRRLFSVRVHKKERSLGRTRISLRNASGGSGGQ